MLRWMMGISLKDRKRNVDIRGAVGIDSITDRFGKQDYDGLGMCGERMKMRAFISSGSKNA